MDDNLILHVLSCSGVREVLLYSLVNPQLFTQQTWKLLCKDVLSASWQDYDHVSDNPRIRFVEIAYRKGLQPAGLSLYSDQYLVLFTLFTRNLEKLRKMAKTYPCAASCLLTKLTTKNKFFFQREVLVLEEELGVTLHAFTGMVAKAEERDDSLISIWEVATRLLINGDEQSLRILQKLFFYRRLLDGKRTDSYNLTLPELVFKDRENVYNWLCAYSFSGNDDMIRELLKCSQNFVLDEVLPNLYTVGNVSLAREIEKQRSYTFSFDEKLSCLANYYLFSGDSKGLYSSLLEVMKEKQPLQKPNNPIFDIELYEVRELLRREGLAA